MAKESSMARVMTRQHVQTMGANCAPTEFPEALTRVMRDRMMHFIKPLTRVSRYRHKSVAHSSLYAEESAASDSLWSVLKSILTQYWVVSCLIIIDGAMVDDQIGEYE